MKEIFFDLHTRRVNAWDGRKKVEPPSEEAAPSMETTPTPRTPLTPTSVSDYPEKAELPLPPPPPPPTNRIVQPVPISTTSMATVYPVTNTFYHHGDTTANTCTPTAIGGAGGESQGGYESVNVVSPHLPQTCSAFIPAAAVQHQQHLQRAQSLSAAHNLQQGASVVKTIILCNLHSVHCVLLCNTYIFWCRNYTVATCVHMYVYMYIHMYAGCKVFFIIWKAE